MNNFKKAVEKLTETRKAIHSREIKRNTLNTELNNKVEKLGNNISPDDFISMLENLKIKA